jgi:SAM-dependent methyltransferase
MDNVHQKVIVDSIDGQVFPRSEEVNCYLCGRTRQARKIPVAFGMQAMVAECPDCRLAFQTPRPSQAASLAYMNWRWRSTDEYVADRASQMRRAAQQIAFVKQFVRHPGKLLDFGAGAGSFVRAARDQGWDATGIEQSLSARIRAKEFYDIELREVLDEERYAVATLWDVIEHLRDPVSVLRLVAEHLTQGGLIFIETGNYESWARVVQNDGWGLYLFDHQFYFSPASLRAVLRRAGFNGFRLLHTNRSYPEADPRLMFRRPLVSMRHWLEWAKARAKWPAHGDIDIMIVVAARDRDPARH